MVLWSSRANIQFPGFLHGGHFFPSQGTEFQIHEEGGAFLQSTSNGTGVLVSKEVIEKDVVGRDREIKARLLEYTWYMHVIFTLPKLDGYMLLTTC